MRAQTEVPVDKRYVKPATARRSVAGRLVLLAVAAAVVSVFGLVTPAAAAGAGPTVTLEPLGRYVVGSTVETYYGEFGLEYWQTSMVVNWKVSAPNRVCKQTLTEQSYDTLGGDPDPILGPETVTTTIGNSVRGHSYSENAMDYDRGSHSFVVRVTDCAGKTSASGIAGTSVAFDEDTDPAITYAGAWSVSHFTGFSGGTTHYATTAGASATVQVSGAVALVMEQAANRGSAAVYVDGVKRATVNTHSDATQHRRVVWQGLLLGGPHTLRVVNLATAGHPRIDIDLIAGAGAEE